MDTCCISQKKKNPQKTRPFFFYNQQKIASRYLKNYVHRKKSKTYHQKNPLCIMIVDIYYFICGKTQCAPVDILSHLIFLLQFESLWKRPVDIVFLLFFVAASCFAIFTGLVCMILLFYLYHQSLIMKTVVLGCFNFHTVQLQSQ